MRRVLRMRSDEATFARIVRTYQRPLYGYIRRMLLSHEDTEDVLQETFAKAYRYLWTVRNPDALKGWLYKIAVNEVRRFLKKHRRAVNEELQDNALVAEEPLNLESVESVAVPRAIGRLSPLEREVFCLKYYDDMDYDEMSRITGAGKNTLMVTWHNARKKVKSAVLTASDDIM